MMLLSSFADSPQLWLAAAPAHERPPDHTIMPFGRRPLEPDLEDEFFISLLPDPPGHVVVGIAVSADEAVRIAQGEQPDVALVDIRLVGARDGIDAAHEIFSRFGVPSIFVTANADPQTAPGGPAYPGRVGAQSRPCFDPVRRQLHRQLCRVRALAPARARKPRHRQRRAHHARVGNAGACGSEDDVCVYPRPAGGEFGAILEDKVVAVRPTKPQQRKRTVKLWRPD